MKAKKSRLQVSLSGMKEAKLLSSRVAELERENSNLRELCVGLENRIACQRDDIRGQNVESNKDRVELMTIKANSRDLKSAAKAFYLLASGNAVNAADFYAAGRKLLDLIGDFSDEPGKVHEGGALPSQPAIPVGRQGTA